MIHFIRWSGYGWAKYADSVLSQGWVSPKQVATLERMWATLSHWRRTRGSWGRDVTQWDDHSVDAMRGGYESNDYF